MSGQQIGAVVGGIIGAFFGMPQVGAAIGGMIGGWIAPTQVNGPHIGDGAAQSSAEGVPIPWIIGTAGWIQGNIVDKSPRREVKKTDDGKGSGTEVNTFEAHQDFVIMVCESSETRESLMTGVLMVRVDGKVVYDMRPESNFAADNAKFLKNHTFYDGNESQLPDPTAEAFPQNGVGNTPYYRGVYTVVCRDINLTQYGDRIPTYEFVMVGAGESSSVTTDEPLVPQLSQYADSTWPLVNADSEYVLSGTRGTETFVADTIAEILEHFRPMYGIDAPTARLYGYSAYSKWDSGLETYAYTAVLAQPSVVDNQYLTLVYNDYLPDHFDDFNDLGDSFSGACLFLPDGPDTYAGRNGVWVYKEPNVGPVTGPDTFFYYCAGATHRTRGRIPIHITVERKGIAPAVPTGDPCLLGVPVVLPDSPGMQINCAGVISPLPTYAVEAGTWRQLALADIDLVDDRLQFARFAQGPILPSSDPNFSNELFWTAAYDAAVADGKLPAGWTYSVQYPAGVSSAMVGTSTTDFVESDAVSVATAITRIAKRGGLTAVDIDVSEMTDMMLGYPITQSYNAADCIRPLMTGFKSYGSEYDAKIHFHKHGEEIEVVINPDDFIEGSDQSDESTREQSIEYPRLLSLTYIDPTQDYTARPQVDRRITPDIRAIGEESMQVPVVLMPDDARSLAAVGMKVSWARAQGTREFSVPYATDSGTYLGLVAGKPFALDGKRWVVKNLRLEDGEIHIEAVYDRQSAYTANVTATPALPPTAPPSGIGGVTLFAALNAGVMRDQDDRLGIYLAVAGILQGWPGCQIQVSADDQASWQVAVDRAFQASTMGYLTMPLPLAPASGDDVTNTLSVSVHGGELNSITRLQFLNEMNPCAIVKPGDAAECEILSFQSADETAPGEYDLTTLSRGGLSSGPAAHAAGARFVALDGVYFYEVPSAWIGRTLWFRAVTLGTSPDNNPAYPVLFNPVVSQTEWEPCYLSGQYVGSAFVASVVPRHRLGNDMNPVQSANFIGYRWNASDGTLTQTFDTVEPSRAFLPGDFTGPVTISVSQLNRFTGPGPSVSVTL